MIIMDKEEIIKKVKTELKEQFDINKGSPKKKSLYFAVEITVILWIILMISFIFVKFEQKPLYKTIKISLATPTKTEKIVKPEKVETSAEKSVQKPVEKKVEKQIQKSQENKVSKTEKSSGNSAKSKPKTQTQTQSKPKPKKEYVYKKSLEEMMEEQFSSPENVEFIDETESEIENFTKESSKNGKNQSLSSNDALEGVAGKTENTKNAEITSSAESQKKSENVSDSTAQLLRNISEATVTNSVSDGIKTTQKINSSVDATGKTVLKLNDGTLRILLEPKKPVIIISKEAAKTIDSSREVIIQFKILKDGSVPLSGISFSPSSALTESIKKEVILQVSKWIFAKGVQDGFAKFEYSIIRK